VPGTGVEAHVMRVVVAPERDAEAIERQAVALAGVPIRLLDLADERAVHRRGPSVAHGLFTGPPPGRALVGREVRSY
jgi:hypothetical protein